MDGENNGKPYEQMDDLGVFPYFWKHPRSQGLKLAKNMSDTKVGGLCFHQVFSAVLVFFFAVSCLCCLQLAQTFLLVTHDCCFCRVV